MSSTPERKVKAQVVKLLTAQGVYYFYPVMGGYGRSGIPDVVCCVKGRFLAIECKAGANKPTALQEREIALIKAAGGQAIVVNENNLAQLAALIQELKQ
jgi:Holliday junction resolvase